MAVMGGWVGGGRAEGKRGRCRTPGARHRTYGEAGAQHDHIVFLIHGQASVPAPWAPPPPSPQPPLPPHWTKDGGVPAAARPLRRVKESRPLPAPRRARPRPPPPRLASRKGCRDPGLSTSKAWRAAPLSESPEGSGAGMAGAAAEGSVRGSRALPPRPAPRENLRGPEGQARAAAAARGGASSRREGSHCHDRLPQAPTAHAL